MCRAPPPFGAVQNRETLRAIVQSEPPTLDGPLGELARRALSRDPSKRPVDGAAFAMALRACLEPVPQRAPTPVHLPTRPPPRWPIAVVALLVGAGLGLTPRLFMPPAEPPKLLPAALALLAHNAAVDNNPALAQLTAVEGLRTSPDHPEWFRGILAAHPLDLQSERLDPLPFCENKVLSPDGTAMACRNDRSLSVIELPEGKERWQRPVRVDTVVWTGDALFCDLAGGTRWGLMDAATGGARPEVDVTLQAGRVYSSPHHDMVLIVNTADSPAIFAPTTGRYRSLEGDGSMCAAEVQSDRTVVGVCQESVFRWNEDGTRDTPGIRSAPHIEADLPHVVAVSADGAWLAEGSLAGIVRVFDLTEGTEVSATTLSEGMVRSLAMSPAGGWLGAVDEQGNAWIWPRHQSTARLRLPGRVDQIEFTAEDRVLTVGTELETWSLPTLELPGVLDAYSGVSGVDWNGDWIAVALGNGTIRRWNTRTGLQQTEQVVDDAVVKDITVSRTGAALAITLSKQARTDWFWTDEDHPPLPTSYGRRVVWSDDRGLVVASHRGGPHVSDATGTVSKTVVRPSAEHVDLEPTATRDGAVLIEASGEVTILAWDGEPTLHTWVREVSGHAVAMAHLDDTVVAVGHLDGVSLYARGEPTPVRTWKTPAVAVDVALSGDGRLVAAGLLDGSTHVWDRHSGELLGVLVGHTERVSGLWFSPDHTRLLTGSWDETLRLWELDALHLPVETLAQRVSDRWGRSPDAMLRSVSGGATAD